MDVLGQKAHGYNEIASTRMRKIEAWDEGRDVKPQAFTGKGKDDESGSGTCNCGVEE